MSRKLKNEELYRLSIEAFKAAQKTPLVVVLDNVRSMNNVGSIFRTCDAFLIEKLYLCGITPKPPHRDIHKTAIGATESVCWEVSPSTLETIILLKQQGFKTLALEQAEGAISLASFTVEPRTPYAIVLGNEVEGISQDVVSACNAVVEIPQWGTKHSLNVAVSAGIAIWQISCQLR